MVGPSGMAEYRKEQARLRDLIEKQRQTSKKLTDLDERIAQLESNYLDSTPSGNIIIGFDSYIKGINSAAQRKRLNAPDQNRVFSRSSVSYKLNTNTDANGANNQAGALTPTFKNDSNNLTPTFATHPNTSGKAGKKKKALVMDDDSEVEVGQPRKRINFGAGRK